MRCPFCAAYEDKVIETRASKDGQEIRRRRECEGCARRYTTYERIEESMPLVIKADGRREPFDRTKIEHGVRSAVAKRPVSKDQIAAIALDVEREIGELTLSEIASRDIGERVLPKLRALDPVAYVRFASIYRDFGDVEGFAKELDAMREEVTGRHDLAGVATVDTSLDPGAPSATRPPDVTAGVVVALEPGGPGETTDKHAAVAAR